jgi:protein SCO1
MKADDLIAQYGSAPAGTPANRRPRGPWLWLGPAALAAIVAATCVAVAFVTVQVEQKAQRPLGDMLSRVGIAPKLNAQVPLDARLRDEQGADVRVGDLVQGKPVILALVYYQCPMLCGMAMEGLVRGLKNLPLDVGGDFTVLVVSFDPRETAPLAAAAKRTALDRYDRAGAESGWRFLTGEASETRRLADAVGFRYTFDDATNQYAHAAGLFVLTPEGLVSRFLGGVEYPPRDLKLALIEASNGKIGSTVDRVMLLCFHYDPADGKYGLAIMRVLRVAGLATVIALAAGIGLMVRNDKGRATK